MKELSEDKTKVRASVLSGQIPSRGIGHLLTPSQTRNLQRVRENQQRSRDKKRAYVTELEEKVRQLTEELKSRAPDEGQDKQFDRVVVENDARRSMLRALDIDDAAQQQFVDAYVKRKSKDVGATPASPSTAEETWTLRSDHDIQEPGSGTVVPLSLPRDATVDLPVDLSSTQMNPITSPLSREITMGKQHSLLTPGNQDLWPGTFTLSPTSGSMLPSSLPTSLSALSPTDGPSCGCSLPDKTLQISAVASGDTTACSVAFSMLLQNNHRGYTTSDMDARLRVGYRRDVMGEGCSVANTVLFQLLSEIS